MDQSDIICTKPMWPRIITFFFNLSTPTANNILLCMTQGNVSTCADVSEAMEEWLVPLWHFYAQDRLTESYKNDPSQYLTNYHEKYVCVFDNVSKPDQKRLLLNKSDLAAQLCDAQLFHLLFLLAAYFLNVLGHLFSGFVTVDFKASCCCLVQILCVTGGSFLFLYFYAVL